MNYTVQKNLERYQKRRKIFIEMLGGKCANCGSLEKLEFDHINSEDKRYNISDIINRKNQFVIQELKKCQILCNNCHKFKNKIEGSTSGGHNKWVEIKHGTLHAYGHYKCRCFLCKEAKRLSR